MDNRDGPNRKRLRPTASVPDQLYTPLGRNSSGNSTPLDTKPVDTSTAAKILPNFDPEHFCSEIKAKGRDEKSLEKLMLNAINSFPITSKRPSQQVADYTVLTFLAWAVTIHDEVFRLPEVTKAMCNLLKSSNIAKSMQTVLPINNGNNLPLPTTPYTLVCQILWLAFKDQPQWPEEFIEVYVDDAINEQNWIKNADCEVFVANIQTAFNTRASTWNLDRPKIPPKAPAPSSTTNTTITTTSIVSSIHDETSNDSNTATSTTQDSIPPITAESESSMAAVDDTTTVNTTDQQLIVPRYEGRSQAVQSLLQNLLPSGNKSKSTGVISSISGSTATSNSTTASTSQPYETEKLLALLEQLCGLPEIRSYILSRLDTWLQNRKLDRAAEKLMVTLCENLTKQPMTGTGHNQSHSFTNGHTNNNHETSYIDEQALKRLANLLVKVHRSSTSVKMYISCIREMLKRDVNLVDIIVRFIVHNELQQVLASSAVPGTGNAKNPHNLSLLQACCDAQGEATCQSLAHSIQNILLLTNVTTTSKDHDSLLRSIRRFLRELMQSAKQEFDSMRFCMHLIDTHYSASLQGQFWAMMPQQDPSNNEITSQRLGKRLLECDMITRERFLYAICDLIPMLILVAAQACLSLTNNSSNSISSTANAARIVSSNSNEHWLLFIQRMSYIQCSCCLFFLVALPRLFESTSTIQPINYLTCLYSVLFTAQISSYVRVENWPSEEPGSLRNEIFRLAWDVPLLGETLYLLIQIGLTPQFRINSSMMIDLIDFCVRRTLTIEQKMSSDNPSPYLRLPDNQCEIFLRRFFELTRYHIPIQIQFPPTYQMPKNLAVTEMFWKTCWICLMLASHDSRVFGRFIWTSVPQIRLFMEMLLTGDYTYPPKSMIATKNFLDKFYMNERVHLREEKDLILELEKYLAAPKQIDESNSQLLGKVILLDLQQIKRPTSHEKNEKNFYNLIQGLNNLFKLSSMLCRCRSPDFILDILNRKEQQGKQLIDTQTSWLTGLIDSNIDCLNVFPIICLCDYFQHTIMTYDKKNKTNPPSKKTLHALDTILNRFKSIIQSVKQDIAPHAQTSASESSYCNDMICILNYFFQCLNSNISTMRSNAWLCLYIILHDHPQSIQIEQLLTQADPLTDNNVHSILSTIAQFTSLDQTQLSVKQTLAETCLFETNIFLLHYAIVFILDHFQEQSTADQQLLANLTRGIIRRHSILYLLIQYDKQEKHYQLTKKFFHLISTILIEKLHHALHHPIEINTDHHNNEQLTSITHTYLILPTFTDEQVHLIQQLQKELNLSKTLVWSKDLKKHYIQLDSSLIEFLLIFLASFDFDHSQSQSVHELANILQKLFLNTNCTPCFMTLKQFNAPVPIRQSLDETSSSEQNEESHFKQFAVEDDEPPVNHRKRRLSKSATTGKVFLSSTNQPFYRPVPINNELEQSLFHSDDVQYFIFKSTNFTLVQHCIDQASFSTCLKMLKISILSHENINYLCQRLNQLLDLSSKQIHTYIKQSSFILPIINRWIVERVPHAIQLGEKFKKLLEKKKKSHSASQHSTSESKSPLIPTSSRSSMSITEQMHSFHRQITDLCESKTVDDHQTNNRMDTSDTSMTLPWKDLNECEELLKRLVEKKFDPVRRRQLLTELQWLTNQREEYRLQLFQAMLQRCRSADVKKFIHNLNEQSNTSLVILGILMKKNGKGTNEDSTKLIEMLKFYETQGKSIFGMKVKDLQRMHSSPGRSRRSSSEESSQSLTINEMLAILCDYYPMRDYRIERSFSRYFKVHQQHEEESQRLLMSVLVEAEDRLSESTVGMILDQLEKTDNQSSRSSSNSIYANRFLFSQRTRTSISQRLLLKQFLHSCDWSTILACIYDLFTLPSTRSNAIASSLRSPGADSGQHHRLLPTHAVHQSRCQLIDNRDSIVILDMLEAFIKLSPLWSGREHKMLDRCHDELLIDLNDQQIYTLVIYILDEGFRRSSAKENLNEQYQKRYETILYYLIKNPAKRILFQRCLEKLFLESPTIPWMKDVLTPFYFILYINQADLFSEHFYLNLPNLFVEIKQQEQQQEQHLINTNSDYILHDLLIRLNSYDSLSLESFSEVHRLLKHHVSKDPYLFLRHLKIIKCYLQSRLSTLTIDEFNRRGSRPRRFFLSLFDLVQRLKPYIYDQAYEEDFQSILDIYIRLIGSHLPALNTCSKSAISTSGFLQDLIDSIDEILKFIYDYFSSTIHNHQHYLLFKTYNTKFFEKISEKVQMNKDLYQVLVSNKQNQILYHLMQLKILYEAVKTDEPSGPTGDASTESVPFDVRLCLVNRSSADLSQRSKNFDIQHYCRKLAIPLDESISPAVIDEFLSTINELKSIVDHYLTIDHMALLLDTLTSYLLLGHRQLMEHTYDLILKFIEKYPQHSALFYSTYLQCLRSNHALVFQMATEHFAHFLIYFQSKSNELFSLLFKQGLINKTDVTTSITQAIRLLTLHRYDPITQTNVSSLTMTND